MRLGFVLIGLAALGCDRYSPTKPDIVVTPPRATLEELNAALLWGTDPVPTRKKGCGAIVSSKIISLGNLTYQAVYYTKGGGIRSGHCAVVPTWDLDGASAAQFALSGPDPSVIQIVQGSYIPGTYTLRAAVTLQSGAVWEDTLTVTLP